VAKVEKKRQTARGGKRQQADKPKDQAAPQAKTLPGTPPPGSALVRLSPPLEAEAALQRRQQKQKWTSKGLPKRQKMRNTVAAILAMKVQGYTTNEIADQLQIKAASVRQYLFIAGREGWLDSRDPHEIAHSQLVHRAVSNAEEWLHARDARTGLPDKEFTLEAMKGFGVFGTGPAQQQESQATNVLAIQITMPASTAGLPQMRDGNAGGVPAYHEGEIIGAPRTPQSRRQLPE
jgi:hypothetical protein